MLSVVSTSVLSLVLLITNVHSSPELTNCRDTSWYSEEQGYPPDTQIGYPMTGLQCKGDYCDDLMALQCTQITNNGQNFDLKAPFCQEMSWTFSEEGAGTGSCPQGMFVESMKCEGGWCDNIRLRCCMSNMWFADYKYPQVTPWFTDDGGQNCPAMHVVIGASCSGSWCDNMLLICAPVKAIAKAGESFGSWSAVCSSNRPGHLCQFTPTMTVKRDRQETWSEAFSTSVNTSISGGIKFLEEEALLQVAVQRNVSQLVSVGKETSRTCSTELLQVTGNSTEGWTEAVWWQWVMDTDDISITDPDGTDKKLRMTTCFFWMTSGFNNIPKCTPGNCADQNCQVCK